MRKAKAQRRGFLLTAIFSALQVLVLNGTLIQGNLVNEDGSFAQYSFWSYVDVMLLCVLVFSWRLGRQYGVDFFITKRRFFETQYLVLTNVTSLASVSTIILFVIYTAYIMSDWSLFVMVFFIPVVLFINALGCIITALVMYAAVLMFFRK